MSCWRRLALAVLLAIGCMHAHGAALSIDLGKIEHPVFIAERVALVISDDASSAEFSAGRFAFGEHVWTDLRLRCKEVLIELPQLVCRGGELSTKGLSERIQIELSYNPIDHTGRLRMKSSAGDAADVRLHADGRIIANLGRVQLARMSDGLPSLARYHPAGYFDGQVELDISAAGLVGVSVVGELDGGGFALDDGLMAAEGLKMKVDVRARQTIGGWALRGQLGWKEGEAYFHPLYLTAPAAIDFVAEIESGMLELTRASLSIEGVDVIEARGRIGLSEGTLEQLAVSLAGADLKIVGPRFVAPLLAPARPSDLSFEGRVSAGIQIESGELKSLDLALDGVSFADEGAMISFGPLSGAIPWSDSVPGTAQLQIEGGAWEGLALGAFELQARLSGRSVEVDRVVVPVLDGLLVLSDLALAYEREGWSGSGAVVIEPISMSLLSVAVGLPPMSGVLSASLPGLRVTPGEIALDGALVISVFDGYLQVTGLQVLEPFGVTSRLYSHIIARNLDLSQLTEAFSFGGMTGFIDADLYGIELAHWRPVRFDAAIRSSPGRYPKRISQRAVQNIGALGGPGVGLALQRGFLGFFETFGYREIGLSCVLDDGVCIMGGIGDSTSGSFEIVRGGGIPALNIMGYNRRVDWNEFIDRLQRVIESNTAPVIR